jgi:hypothetical protein
MPKIVILCRTTDAFGISGRIYDALRRHFGRGAVFLDDVDQNAASDQRRFREVAERAREADVFLVSVGRNWLNGIKDDADPIRSILRTALESGVVVTPVLVNGAAMPGPDQLPQDIKNFAYRNAAVVDPGPDFDAHVKRLMREIETIVGVSGVEIGSAGRASEQSAAAQRAQTVAAAEGRIFISHSSHDRKVAETLVQALEARGLPCWISSRDVPGGANYQASIVHAIRNAKVMLLVFTESANNSDEIKKEIALASRNNLVVIPVRIEDVVPNDALEFELSTRQWIDFFGDWERAVEALCKRILSILTAERPAGLGQRGLM